LWMGGREIDVPSPASKYDGKLNRKRSPPALRAISNLMGANGFDGVVNSESRAEVPVARKTMGKSQKPILNWLSQPN